MVQRRRSVVTLLAAALGFGALAGRGQRPDPGVDLGPVAGLITAAATVLAFATRLNPLWLLLAGGALGFAGVV